MQNVKAGRGHRGCPVLTLNLQVRGLRPGERQEGWAESTATPSHPTRHAPAGLVMSSCCRCMCCRRPVSGAPSHPAEKGFAQSRLSILFMDLHYFRPLPHPTNLHLLLTWPFHLDRDKKVGALSVPRPASAINHLNCLFTLGCPTKLCLHSSLSRLPQPRPPPA